MDRIRQALGLSTISFYGLSYGTVLGTVYADLFPHRVRAMVLDGAVDMNARLATQATEQAPGRRARRSTICSPPAPPARPARSAPTPPPSSPSCRHRWPPTRCPPRAAATTCRSPSATSTPPPCSPSASRVHPAYESALVAAAHGDGAACGPWPSSSWSTSTVPPWSTPSGPSPATTPSATRAPWRPAPWPGRSAARWPLIGGYAVTYNLGGCVAWPDGRQPVSDTHPTDAPPVLVHRQHRRPQHPARRRPPPGRRSSPRQSADLGRLGSHVAAQRVLRHRACRPPCPATCTGGGLPAPGHRLPLTPGPARARVSGRRATRSRWNARRGHSAAARVASSTRSAVDGRAVDHRVAPLVEGDPFGQQLGAVAEGVTGHRVDPDPQGHRPPGPAHDAAARQCRGGREGQHASGACRPSHGSAGGVGGGVGGEHRQGAAHQPGHAVRDGGRRRVPTTERDRSSMRPTHRGVGPAGGQQLEVVGHGGEPVHARPALSGALAGHPAGDPGRLGDPARRGGQRHDDPDAEGGPGPGQRSRGEAGWRPAPGASQAPPYPPTRKPETGPVGPAPADHVGDRRAQLDLDDARGRCTAPDTVTRVVPGCLGGADASGTRPPRAGRRGRPGPGSRRCGRGRAGVRARSGTDLSTRRTGRASPSVEPVRPGRTPRPSRTGPAGARRTSSGPRAGRRARRRPARTARAVASRSSATQTTITERAPDRAAASSAPSRTRWGDQVRRVRSLALAGSPSMALTTTTGRRPERRTASHLAAAGKPPPPRPVSPEAATSARRASAQAGRRRRARRGGRGGPGGRPGPGRWPRRDRRGGGARTRGRRGGGHR